MAGWRRHSIRPHLRVDDFFERVRVQLIKLSLSFRALGAWNFLFSRIFHESCSLCSPFFRWGIKSTARAKQLNVYWRNACASSKTKTPRCMNSMNEIDLSTSTLYAVYVCFTWTLSAPGRYPKLEHEKAVEKHKTTTFVPWSDTVSSSVVFWMDDW